MMLTTTTFLFDTLLLFRLRLFLFFFFSSMGKNARRLPKEEEIHHRRFQVSCFYLNNMSGPDGDDRTKTLQQDREKREK